VRRGLSLLLAAFTVGRLGSAVAAPPHRVWVRVDRASESLVCPDGSGILKAAGRLFPDVELVAGSAADVDAVGIEVSIRPDPGGHVALLRVSGARQGERTLHERDAACGGLADALAVALVLIVEPDAAARPPPPSPVEPRARREPRAIVPPPSRRAPRDRQRSGFEPSYAVGAGAVGAIGVLATPSVGGFAGVEAMLSSGPGLRLRALRLVADPVFVEPGRITTSVWAGQLGACWRLRRGSGFAITPCVELAVGRQRGAGHDFRRGSYPVTRPFWSLGPTISTTRELFAGFHAGILGGLGVNLWRQTYLVDDAAESVQPRLGVLLALGVGFEPQLQASGRY
jgi:hypothetical protein